MEPEGGMIDGATNHQRPAVPLPPPLPPPGMLLQPMFTIFLRPSQFGQEQQDAEQPSSNAMPAEPVFT